MAAHEYRDRLLQRPERLWDDKGNVKGLEEYLVARIAQATAQDDANTVLALVGCGGLFGLFSVSRLIERVAEKVLGRPQPHPSPLDPIAKKSRTYREKP